MVPYCRHRSFVGRDDTLGDMMALLTVSLDQVGALRDARKLMEPDPVQAAVLAELAGANGLAVQLRRDRRYIRDRDLYMLREAVKTRLTIEMAPVDENVEKALEVKPSMVSLVADYADTDTPVAGIDFDNPMVDFSDIALRLKGVGIGVCFFVEPDADAVRGAARAGATVVMLNCGGFTQARTLEEAQQELDRIDRAAQAAAKAGLPVHAARGVGYNNVSPLRELNLIDDFVVGHAIVSRAVLCGFDRAVRDMLRLIGPRSLPA